MGCLKLQAEENYTALKVVYSVVNTNILKEQAEKNKSVFLEVGYREAQSNGGVNWNSLHEGLQGADFIGVGAAIGREVLMDYRRSLPAMERIGMSSNVRAISILGTASKYLGAAGIAGGVLSVGLDASSMQAGQLSVSRFSYNTLGTSLGIGVGVAAGPIPGAVIGGSFLAGQQMYDGYMYWAQQMSTFINNFENGLKNGWVPGRR